MMSEDRLKIGLGQLDMVWEDKEENRKKVRKMVQEASYQGVELLVFPEMTLTGFSMEVEKTWEEDGETVEFFKDLSQEFQMCIGFGYVKKSENKGRNQFCVVKDGEVLTEYTKIHPFSYGKESLYFEAGNEITGFTLKNFHMGMFICYDLRFPEVFQLSARKNQVILLIADWPKARVEHFRTLLKARAIENQCFMVAVNRVGIEKEVYYEGSSAIYSPKGELLTKEVDEESLIVTEINLVDILEYRKSFPQREDKRTELYCKLYRDADAVNESFS
ncbi:MAG: carbon-nitrogen family hydrolase [Lachnospiraceae bacterium]|nr:carbon-nitrogen family hydrolase [Lachnospiraceae bacterium]